MYAKLAILVAFTFLLFTGLHGVVQAAPGGVGVPKGFKYTITTNIKDNAVLNSNQTLTFNVNLKTGSQKDWICGINAYFYYGAVFKALAVGIEVDNRKKQNQEFKWTFSTNGDQLKKTGFTWPKGPQRVRFEMFNLIRFPDKGTKVHLIAPTQYAKDWGAGVHIQNVTIK